MTTDFSKPIALAGALLGLALLPACSTENDTSDDQPGVTQDATTRTLVAALGDASDLGTLRTAIDMAELGSIFDGRSTYTLLAPNDAAFEALGETGETLMSEDQRPLLVGIVRNHILPGQVTLEDITAAIEANGGEVTMTTLGDGTVTFSKTGDTITVSNGQGASATNVSSATATSNGVIIPLDGVLVPKETPAG